MDNVREIIKSKIKFTKTGRLIYRVEYDDEEIYKEIDKIISLLGSLDKYSDSVNNALADSILKRLITDLFVEEFNVNSLDDLESMTIEHPIKNKAEKKVFFIGKIIEKAWGEGIIYGLK